jgi:undecaprenyl-diphosphatase
VAEVVPVSSSGQLVLLPWLLGWPPPRDRTTFAAGLHAGSCLGIAWAVRADLRALDRRTALLVAGASLPAAVAGALAADAVEERLGRPPQLAALLAVAGLGMWAVDARAERRGSETGRCSAGGRRGGAPVAATVPPGRQVPPSAPDDPAPARPAVGLREAALAGAAQVVALVPGVSRAGATLTALRAAGVPRAEAERFSLLMSLPVTAGAAALTLARTDRTDLAGRACELAPGAVTAAVAGSLAVRRRSARPGTPLRGAALYRLGLAIAVVLRLRHRKDGS